MAGLPLPRLLLFSMLALVARGALALEVRETIWGFDGRVVPGRFNPVSVLVENPGPSTFDGQIVLSSMDGLGAHRGTEYVQPAFLAPRTTRWLQFQIFVGNSIGHYLVEWGKGAKDRYELPGDTPLGPPSCVWLRDSDNQFGPAGALKSFPDELFPTTVIATDGLASVVLDHTPRWEAVRREAFLAWLKRGGIVHLLPSADGKYPALGDDLNAAPGATEIRVGLGRIVLHQIGPREMSEPYLAEHGFPAPVLKQAQNPVVYDLEALLSQRLSALTRPTVNWTLIHLLALAYIGMIGPLHYRFRRRFDYRVSMVAFLLVVAAFSAAFAVVGRRGYGESQTVHSLAIARSLGGGRHDVTQWVSAFATKGDLYTLTHDAPANLYGTDARLDAGSSQALNGKDGRIQMDIPLYSSRTFIHRGVMAGDDTTVTVDAPPSGAKDIRKLRLRIGPNFPKEFSEARLFADHALHELVRRNGALEVADSPRIPASTYFARERLQPLSYANQFVRNPDPDAHRQLMPLLLARALGVPDVFLQTALPPPDATPRMQLCIVAPAPPSFHLRGPGFERERGWVLYVQDIIQP